MHEDTLQATWLDEPRLCLHLPPPCDFDAVTKTIATTCLDARKSFATAQLPRPESFRFRLMRRPNVFDWFSATTNVSLETAKQIIDGFPIRVHPDFRCNAMNPMRFLGLAAAILEHPDVLLYEVSGMDPVGRAKIHSYAREHYNCGCLVHACWVPLSNDCPNVGECRAVTLLTQTATEQRVPPKPRAERL